MKVFYLVLISCAGLFLHSCGPSVWDNRYTLDFPEIPHGWEALLGSPLWRIEWPNDEGRKKTMVVRGNDNVEISPLQNWVSAVSAWPFWPDKGIGPGIFRPAGAIFPFDASGTSLSLSWQGGIDANLFWEIALAYETNDAGKAAVPRLPWNFNWPRFRELFDDSSLNTDIRADPWLANWHTIAEKIVLSGFDKRRLVPETRITTEVPVGPGPWISVSPFAPPLFFEAVPSFSVRPSGDTWVSNEGILRCNAETWMLID
jgi:hypothetical protein